MAVFSKNTLAQVSGFSNAILACELVYNQRTYWNLTITSNSAPVDLTGASINAQILRREISNLNDTRNGLTFDISDYDPAPEPIDLTIANISESAGQFTLVIDSTAWGLIAGDAQLDIAVNNPVAYSGRVKVSFPASGATPAEDQIVFLLFLVRSDGVVN